MWLDALRRECLRNYVSLHSYPSYTQAESGRLEYYAISPYKFVARVSEQNVRRRHRKRVLRLRTTDDDKGGDIRYLLVVPGGRYIVTGSSGGSVVIWDLNGGEQPSAVSKTYFPKGIRMLLLAPSTGDAAIIRVLVVHWIDEPAQLVENLCDVSLVRLVLKIILGYYSKSCSCRSVVCPTRRQCSIQ